MQGDFAMLYGCANKIDMTRQTDEKSDLRGVGVRDIGCRAKWRQPLGLNLLVGKQQFE